MNEIPFVMILTKNPAKWSSYASISHGTSYRAIKMSHLWRSFLYRRVCQL